MLIKVGDKIINKKYIKMITPTHIILANTEQCSISVASSYYCEAKNEKTDRLIPITPIQYQLFLDKLTFKLEV